jgi:ubiquitin-like protein Pup
MSEQVRKTPATRETEGTTAELKATPLEKGRRIGSVLDALLEDIDDVLEENAAEFVKDYVQHGGQ